MERKVAEAQKQASGSMKKKKKKKNHENVKNLFNRINMTKKN